MVRLEPRRGKCRSTAIKMRRESGASKEVDMRNIRFNILGAALLACLGMTGCGSLGSMSSGEMDWVQPETQANHAGTVYLVRGWMGIFSGGMDRLGEEIDKTGVNARVYQHDQCAELARTMAERYRNS